MAVTPAPAIDTLPTAPSRGDPSGVFAPAVGAFLQAMPTWGVQVQAAGDATEANAAAAEAAASLAEAGAATAAAALVVSGFVATSATPWTFAAGDQLFQLDPAGAEPYAFEVDDQVVLVRRGDVNARAYATVADYDGGAEDLTLSFAAEGLIGTGGPFSDWVIASEVFANSGATAAELLAGVSPFVAVTPYAVKASLVAVALTDAATVTPDLSLGVTLTWLIGGNRALALPINCYVGQWFWIEITQDGTGGRTIAYAGGYDRQGGPANPAAGIGAKTYLQGRVCAVSGGNATLAVYSLIRAPG